MTRETKIGLFVGMGVIILIGILISDHLSTVSQQQSAPLASAGAQMQPETLPPVPSGLGGPNVNAGIVTVPNGAAPHRDVVDLVAPPPVPPTPYTPPANDPVTFNNDPNAHTGNTTGPVTHDTTSRNATTGNTGTGTVAGLGGQFERVTAGGTTTNTGTTLLNTAPKQTVHFVKDGETLTAISRQYFGDQMHMQAIYEANKDKMSTIHSLRPGVRLVIPAKATDTAKVTDTKAIDTKTVGTTTAGLITDGITLTGNGTANNTSTGTTTLTTGATGKTNATLIDYKIQEGETLSTIAEKIYGSKAAWQKLYAINKDRVPNPNRMKPGTVISVPKNP